LLLTASTGVTISPHVFPDMKINPVRDLKPIMVISSNAFVLLVNNDLPARSTGEFVKYALANPDKLSHASNSAGTMMVSELFKSAAHVDYLDVNYRGAAQALVATMGGTTQLCFIDIGTATAAIQAKTLRVLGISSPERYKLNPDIPTFVEAGYPVSALATTLLMVSAATPRQIAATIYEGAKKALASPDIVAKLNSMGNVVNGAGLEDAEKVLSEESSQWEKLVKARNIRLRP
jgi:tripartite-type tricarboxylate transporter receptor subunit TctC